ncbi:hypothetical protein BIU98_09145 [Curtobacterium sp. MMLR14_010]|jgi:hypothetical protein|uniref:hypothetical protein n=1 Tax=Curtobacterium sp. MMLR14_010 TaxID=1898743 RepID=UPI0008DD15BA|nr:hypothetical protein [Curtobacterium sp. MMLR14_010]OII31944.1 hypothetical protein BIU98_09145 [Curtobacterium sp. MMLR14_010]
MTDDDVEDRYGAFTLDELADYLDSGRDPVRPEIETDADASAALRRLEQLRVASADLLDADVRAAGAADDDWIARVLASIRTTAHAGRDIPVPDDDPTSRLVVTEGAIRGLVRVLGDALPGVLVRRTRFEGDVTTPGAAIHVEVVVALAADAPLRERADALRELVAAALHEHAPFAVASLTVRVADVLIPGEPT